MFKRMTSFLADKDTSGSFKVKTEDALAGYFGRSGKVGAGVTHSDIASSKGFTKKLTKGKTSTFIDLDDKSATEVVDPSVPVKGHAYVNG